MKLARHNLNQSGTPASSRRAFTLIEMLVVLGIIGILAAMTLPSFKSAGKGNVLESAMRQLQDDLAQARLKAMSSRSRVYVVFAPDLGFFFGAGPMSSSTSNYLYFNPAANNLVGGQLTSYALYAPRAVGEQPGRSTPRYLSEWHSLPNGAFIPAGAFRSAGIFHNVSAATAPLVQILLDDAYNSSVTNTVQLPFIGFDESGRLFARTTNIALPVVEGSLMHPKDSTGTTNLVIPTDAMETAAPVPQTGGIVPGIEYLVLGPTTPLSLVRYPPGGGGTNYLPGTSFTGSTLSANFTPTGNPRVVQFYGLRIDALTGRARAVRPEIQ